MTNRTATVRERLSSAKPHRFLTGAALCAVLAAFAVPGVAIAGEPADRFIESLESDASIPADLRATIRRAWTNVEDRDGAAFLTQGLAAFSERFRSALDAYDHDDYEACVTILRELRDNPNPFLAMNAMAYELKSLVALERLEEARLLIESLRRGRDADADPISQFSYFAPEVDFLWGYCLLADLQYAKAHEALQAFLVTHPDATQRLTLAARQMLAELENRKQERIGDVVDLMNYSRRRLASLDAGDPVRARQQRILDLLDRMIDDAEQQEQQSSSGGGGGGSSQGQAPSNPMEQSQLPGGAPAPSPLRETRRANPGEAWGAMPAAQRERILQALRESFPGKYRQLVEQYYEELAKKP